MITVLQLARVCKHVVKYDALDNGEKPAIDQIYVDKGALGRLHPGAFPETITVTLSVDGERP